MAKRLNLIPDEYNEFILDFFEVNYSKDLRNKMEVSQMCAEEVSKMLTSDNGTPTTVGESAVRKRYDLLRKGYVQGMDETASDKQLERLAKAEVRTKFNSKKVGKMNSVVNAKIREISERSLVREICEDNFDFYRNPKEVTITYLNSSDTKDYPVYLYSDFHYGKVVDVLKNKYNEEIAKKRLKAFFDFVYEDVIKNGYTEFEINDLGDSLEGSTLRTSQLYEITQHVIKQADGYSQLLHDLLFEDFLPKFSEDVTIHFGMITESNHSQLRHFQSSRNEFEEEDVTILVAHDLEKTTKVLHKVGQFKNFKFTSGEFLIRDYDGYKVIYEHGHKQKKGDKILDDHKEYFDEDFHCAIAGHFHSLALKTKGLTRTKDGVFSLQKHLLYIPSIVGNDRHASENKWFSGAGALKVTINGDTGIKGIEFINLQRVT